MLITIWTETPLQSDTKVISQQIKCKEYTVQILELKCTGKITSAQKIFTKVQIPKKCTYAQ